MPPPSSSARRPLGRGPGVPPPAPAAPEESNGPPEPPEPPNSTAPAPEAAEPAPDAPEAAGPEAIEPAPEAADADAPGSVAEPEPEPAAPEPAAAGPETERETAGSAPPFGTTPPAPRAGPSGPVGAGAGETAGTAADDGRFTVRLANFEGPFDLLLQLISKHKMDVTEVALSRVTDEFMAHIRAMGPDWDLDQTTEFLVVAATLLDLKAARLLPAAEVEDEADLALLEARDLLFARLLQYRAYKQVAAILDARLVAEARRYPRTVGLEPHHAALLPEVVISVGPEGFAALAVKAMQPKPRPQVYVDHIHAPLVSVREQAGIVVALLRERGEASFQALTADAADTLTVVARFLALLELYRERAVSLGQEEALGPLMVRWTGGDGDEVPAVTDEFDRAAGDAEDAGAAEDAGEAEEKV
ncbi:segregation and condensation protein A [Streptomyces sp. NPDC002018]|uniref:segregation and condensation protein A n=1 Tax=Streptomyces sp. NPDC002018 TaxID=3364629 RepID=UPI0036AB7FA5